MVSYHTLKIERKKYNINISNGFSGQIKTSPLLLINIKNSNSISRIETYDQSTTC